MKTGQGGSRRRDSLRRMRARVAEEHRGRRVIANVADVFAHFGADFTPARSFADNNRALSRRIYKDTSCGAWASCLPPGRRANGKKTQERWACPYRKVDGAWERGMLRRMPSGAPVEDSDVPRVALDYFWPPIASDGIQEAIEALAEGRSAFEVTETIDIPIEVSHAGAFLCGSIVEGADAEVNADPVYLPCTAADLDAAVQYVEDEAQEIWGRTHGCEDCGEDCDEDGEVGGAINPECPSCGGRGAIL